MTPLCKQLNCIYITFIALVYLQHIYLILLSYYKGTDYISHSQMSTHSGSQCFAAALKCNFRDYEEVAQFLYNYLC